MGTPKHHPEEESLHRLALGSRPLEGESRRSIERHVAACALCREKLESLRTFYAAVARGIEGGPTERDRRLAAAVSAREAVALRGDAGELRKADQKTFETYAEVQVPSRPGAALRLFRAVRMYPTRSAGGAVLLVALALLVFSVLPARRDANPYFAEIRSYVLTVYNRESEILWTKPVPGVPDWGTNSQGPRVGEDPNRYLLVADIHGNGTNDILLTGDSYDGEYARDTVYCFDAAGGLRWKSGAGDWVSFGPKDANRHSRGGVVDFTCLRRTPGAPPQTFILWSQETFSPGKLAEVRPSDGTVLHSFFNKGGCCVLRHADIDGNGVEELLVGGVNDGFNKAFLAVLDPARIDGYAPVPAEYAPAGIGESPLLYYLLFPYSPLPAHLRTPAYGTMINLIIAPGRPIQANVREWLFDPGNAHTVMASIYFAMDSTLRITGVMPDDVMLVLAKQNGRAGRPGLPPGTTTFDALKDSVLYWDGEEFSRTPVVDARYQLSLARGN